MSLNDQSRNSALKNEFCGTRSSNISKFRPPHLMPGPQPVQYNKGGGRPLFFSKFESTLLVERTMKQLNKSTFRLNGLWRVDP